ncbi:hypothetical protein ACA910_001713 [Epithemia clementina (nom. ined.)]
MIEGYSTNLRESRLRQTIQEDAKAYNEYASAALELMDPHISDQGLCTVIRSTRDIDQNKRRRYLYHIPLLGGQQKSDDNCNMLSIPPVELYDNILSRIPSPSGRKVAIFREEITKESSQTTSSKRRAVLEVWTDYGNCLSRRILLPESQHGKLIFDGATFGGPSWNRDETVLVYVAERTAPSTASFFDSPNYEDSFMNDGNEGESSGEGHTPVIRGGVHTLGGGKYESWGEKYHRQAPLLDLFLANVETGLVGKVENCPGSETGQTTTLKSFALGQPVFEPTLGQTIVYVAWDAGGGPEMPRRLGLLHCQQRPSKLYASPVGKLLERLMQRNLTSTQHHYNEDPNKQNNSEDNSAHALGQSHDQATSTANHNGGTTGEDTRADAASEKDGACYCLTLENRLARCPLFSPTSNGGSRSKLVYLSSADGFDTHSGCFGLSSMDWSNGRPVTSSHRTLLSRVWDPNKDNPKDSPTVLGMKFPGLFLNQLPTYCFLSPEYILVTTQWGSALKVVRISLKTGDVIPIQHSLFSSSDDMQSDCILCVHGEQGALGMTSSPHKTPIVWHVSTSRLVQNEKSIVIEPNIVKSISAPIAASKFSPIQEKTELKFNSHIRFLSEKDLPRAKGLRDGIPLQTILLLPDNSSDNCKRPPLIVVPHGGPHGVSPTTFLPSYAYLCGYGGYAVALVNYRGSSGFGQAFIECLPGHIGSLDVKDIVTVTRDLKKSGLIDPNRVGICGGSHGGFLTAHCTGQYPDLFQAAAMRNPVTNLPSMSTATDIPDWVFVEALGKYDWMTYRPPLSQEEIAAFWSKSPIRYVGNVKTPTLVALGLQDLRVPPSQGLEWYHSLRSSRTRTKLLMYEDNDHAIGGTSAEADVWVNIKRWFDEHL